MKGILSVFLTICLLISKINCEEESLAGSFLSGLLDTITSTAESKDCPGICINSFATIICYEVLDDVPCPSSMKCCIENAPSKNTSLTSQKIPTTTTPKSTTKRIATTTKKSVPTKPPKNSNKEDENDDTDDDEEDDSESETSNSCSGVCVSDRIAEYCEAYFITSGLCKTGTKCCVTLGLYPSGKYPKDLYIPENRVGNKTATNKPTNIPGLTKITSATEPARVKTNSNQKSTKSPNKKITTTELPEVDEESEENGETLKECEGDCVSGLFSLFCDTVDSEAYCPGEGSCCLTGSETTSNNNVEEKVVITTIRPPPIPQQPVTENFLSQILNLAENTLANTNYGPSPSTPPPPKLQRCPGYCVHSIMAGFCERPSVLISNTSNCKGSLCCDNTRNVPNKNKQPPPMKRPSSPSHSHTPSIIPPTPIPDPREKCPGSCIVSLLSFTCFRNAEMTDLFKCEKSGQMCCAPKSRIQEKQGLIPRNETFAYPPPPAHHYQPHLPPSPNGQQIHNPHYPTNVLPGQMPAATLPPPPTTTTTTTTTTTPRVPVYSKYVCGVKGTSRTGKTDFLDTVTLEREKGTSPARRRRQLEILDHNTLNITKSSERLVLGTAIVPIQIQTDKLGDLVNVDFARQMQFREENQRPEKLTLRRRGRVVGGEDGENGEWCWQVALINSLNQYLCGAALIGTQWVLTAAHCVTNIVRSGDAIYVRVGDYDLTRKYGSPGAQTLRVATTYIHHNHNSQTLDNDIALLKLHGQAELRDGVCLVCLPARGANHAAGKRCTVTGYGYMGEAGPIPLRVREAEIPVVSDSECIRKVNAVTEKIFILPASSFCSGGEEGNDACQGDGGGPLVCQDDGFFELAGLVSWGFGCGRLDVPGVYVKVSSFIGWINQIISVNNL